MIKILLAVFSIISLTFCTYKPGDAEVIRIKGSDTMLKLTENLAEEYMKLNPGISIYVAGGGTAKGVEAMIKGEIDISTASRNLQPDEIKVLSEYYGTVGMFYLVAKDALTIYVNENNPVKNFTIDQLKKIFECKITNWNELGGIDTVIVPVIRNINSGTHLYFKEHILLGDNYCNNVQVKSTTDEILDYVSENINAVGYGGIGYKRNIVQASVEGVAPNDSTVRSDTYPITRYLHFFTSKTSGGAVKRFIDWVLSPAGQKIVQQSGFISLWEK